MKTIITLLFMILFANAHSQWFVQSTVPGSPNINTISIAGPGVVWVAGDNTALYKTTNGGLNWLQRNSGLPAGNLYGISALDTTTCWVGTVNGSIYKTTNGGFNWTLQFSLAGSFSNGIKMFNANYGVYQGDPTGNGQPYQFRYTTNGGTNWILSPGAPLATSEFGVINAWDWTDTTHFWIGSANTVANATSAKVYTTTNGFGGGGWTSATLPGVGGTAGLYYQAVAFTDVNNGMAGSNGSNIMKTTNGGVTWSTVTNPPGVTAFAAINMNGLKDGSNIIRVSLGDGVTNYLFSTTNLGTTWTQELLPPAGQTNGIQHMQFVDFHSGYAGGNAGTFMVYVGPSGISTVNNGIPGDFKLEQNYPNPFNPSTTINFSIPVSSEVSLKVYYLLGKEVASLVNEFKNAGNYSVNFNAGSNLTSGIYYYTISAGSFTSTKKLMLVK
ncbi:MAG: T9SS type A sorting domain-containing protein [Ignavibacteria bacterium]|nr:T9SS type A sorting domain-containing protein [Ignavibacteria bacterium]